MMEVLFEILYILNKYKLLIFKIGLKIKSGYLFLMYGIKYNFENIVNEIVIPFNND